VIVSKGDIEMDRRQFLKNSTAVVAAAGTGALPWRARAQAAPIKVGLLAPLTGVVASGGKEMVEGVQFYLESVNYQIAGRKVELAIEDDASNPDTALQKARRLVEQGNCHMLIGDLLANTGLAVANYVKGTGTPYFIPIIAADDLTQRQRDPRCRIYRERLHPSVRRLVPQAGLQEDRDHQPGLYVRS
jgi:branched-chain amino acid transport system substrate-binding protein